MESRTVRFTLDDQLWFASATGDYNPIHVDPDHVRHSPFEKNLVHGVHAALAALDYVLGQGRPTRAIERLSCVFSKPIFIDEDVTIAVQKESERSVVIGVVGDDETLLKLTVHFAEASCQTLAEPELSPTPAFPRERPREPLFDAAEPTHFSLPLAEAQRRIFDRYPAATARLGAGAVASLASLSTVVGMYWPGLRSLFSNFSARFVSDGPLDRLEVVAEPVDDRLHLTSLAASNAFIVAEMQAFATPAPVNQPTCAHLAGRVEPGRFAAQFALIVGATDGLGSVAARLLALGGADVTITFNSKEREALDLCAEIRAADGRCAALRFDALGAAPPALESPVNAVYFFASPKIFLRKTRFFDFTRFVDFTRMYVDSMARLAQWLARRDKSRKVAVFYPSTVAIDDGLPDLNEYSAAKLAGELIARSAERSFKNLNFVIERLPRLETQQTNTVIKAQSADTVDVLLPILDAMKRAIAP